MTIRWPWVPRERYDAERKKVVDAAWSCSEALEQAERAERKVLALTEAKAIAQADAAKWEAIAHQLEQTIDGAKVMLACSEERYADLLPRYHMLKLQGFSEPAAPVARPVVAPDPIKRAIAQRAGTNRPLREAMERQVATDRLLGKSDEEILSAIIAGVSGEELILSEAGLMSP